MALIKYPSILACPEPNSIISSSLLLHPFSDGTSDQLEQPDHAAQGPGGDAVLGCSPSAGDMSTVDFSIRQGRPRALYHGTPRSLRNRIHAIDNRSSVTAFGTAFPPGLRIFRNTFDVVFVHTCRPGRDVLSTPFIGMEDELAPTQAYQLLTSPLLESTICPPKHEIPKPDDQQQRFQCHACPQVLTTKDNLRRHYRSVHKDLCDPFYFCRCGKTDARKDNHVRHVLNCNRHPNSDSYSCKCGIQNAEKDQHLGHVRPCCFDFFRRNQNSA